MHVARIAALLAGVLAASSASALSIKVQTSLYGYQDTLAPASGQVDPTVASSTTYTDDTFGTSSAIACVSGSTANCTKYAPAGSTIVLNFTGGGTNTTFAGWTGCNSVNGTECTVLLTSSRVVTVNYKPTRYEVRAKTYPIPTATWTPSYGGSLSGAGLTDYSTGVGGAYGAGTALNGVDTVFTATPNAGSRVKSWSGCTPALGLDPRTCTLKAYGPTAVSVTFEGNPTGPQLVTGQVAGAGTLTSGTSGQSDYMACTQAGGDCSAFVAYNGSLILNAEVPAGGKLAGFTGCSSTSGISCTLTAVTTSKAVTATFKAGSCSACHGLPPAAPHVQNTACGACHPGYTEGTVNTAIHANGVVNVSVTDQPVVLPLVPAEANGIVGIVHNGKGERVANAKVYAIPTGDLKQDSIYTPPEYEATHTYAVGELAEAHEGVYRALNAGTLSEPPALDQRNSNPDWEFIAVVHTPHGFSNRNAYSPDDLVIFASTTTPGLMVASVYESLRLMEGSAEGNNTPYWSTINGVIDPTMGSTTANPPADALSSNTSWKYIGPANGLPYFDNIPQWIAAKSYPTGALVRNGGNILRNGGATATSGATAPASANSFNDGTIAWTNLGSLLSKAIAAHVDEPLEGTIRAHNYGATHYAVTDANGVYKFTALPSSWTGRYYLTVIPDAADTAHLPGGSKARIPLAGDTQVAGTTTVTGVKGTQINIEVVKAQTAAATYVGPTKCLSCHQDKLNTKMTAHGLGIRKAFVEGTSGQPAPGGNQDFSLFPNWYFGLDDFEAVGGTKLCATLSGTSWKYLVRTDCTGVANLKFSLDLGNEVVGGKKYYTVTLTNLAGGTNWPGSNVDGTARTDGKYFIELSYGGGIHKQRYLAKIGAQRFTLPLQINDEGSTDEALAGGRLRRQDYNNGDWFDSATNNHKQPGAHKSFDSMCAGCHFTGYKLNLAANTASAVADPNGEYDYDGDGDLDVMNISCESCHGPGSEHVANAPAGIVNPSKLTPERELTICSQCHTRFVGKGGVQNAGAYASEAPLKDVAGEAVMPRPGISRKEFLANHITRIDDGIWDSKYGNGKYSVKHHQQASDFLTTEKYRNIGLPKGGWSIAQGNGAAMKAGLMTCSGCHDLHGSSGVPRQLVTALDQRNGAATTNGLCRQCHSKTLDGGGHTARGSPSGAGGHTNAADMPAGTNGWTCASCHVPKTAKSGAGALTRQIGGETFYRGDISSHLFIGVPYVYYTAPMKLATDVKSLPAADSAKLMPLPYTNECGSCHNQARTNWKDGFIQ